jgi:hypothetical protein
VADKKVKLGSPLPLSDEELEQLAQITDDDIEAAKNLWRKNAPDEFRDLLDAVEVEEGEL